MTALSDIEILMNGKAEAVGVSHAGKKFLREVYGVDKINIHPLNVEIFIEILKVINLIATYRRQNAEGNGSKNSGPHQANIGIEA